MAVLVEGISVVIRADRLLSAFGGDWEAFKAIVPNKTLCADGELVRVGFMSPREASDFVNTLQSHGLRYIVDAAAMDLTVVDQLNGLCAVTDWAECGSMSSSAEPNTKAAVCRLKGSNVGLVTPDGWRYENSLTTQHLFLRTSKLATEDVAMTEAPSNLKIPTPPSGSSSGDEASFAKWDNGRNFHKGVVALVAIYAWQIYSVWVAIAVTISLTVAILISAAIIANWSEARGKEPWPLLRLNRWFWVIVSGGVLALSAAQVCDTKTGICTRMIKL